MYCLYNFTIEFGFKDSELSAKSKVKSLSLIYNNKKFSKLKTNVKYVTEYEMEHNRPFQRKEPESLQNIIIKTCRYNKKSM